MTDRKEDFAKKSTALEANLRETAADVQIPEEYLPLLEAARPHYGLHQDLNDLLREYFVLAFRHHDVVGGDVELA